MICAAKLAYKFMASAQPAASVLHHTSALLMQLAKLAPLAPIKTHACLIHLLTERQSRHSTNKLIASPLTLRTQQTSMKLNACTMQIVAGARQVSPFIWAGVDLATKNKFITGAAVVKAAILMQELQAQFQRQLEQKIVAEDLSFLVVLGVLTESSPESIIAALTLVLECYSKEGPRTVLSTLLSAQNAIRALARANYSMRLKDCFFQVKEDAVKFKGEEYAIAKVHVDSSVQLDSKAALFAKATNRTLTNYQFL